MGANHAPAGVDTLKFLLSSDVNQDLSVGEGLLGTRYFPVVLNLALGKVVGAFRARCAAPAPPESDEMPTAAVSRTLAGVVDVVAEVAHHESRLAPSQGEALLLVGRHFGKDVGGNHLLPRGLGVELPPHRVGEHHQSGQPRCFSTGKVMLMNVS